MEHNDIQIPLSTEPGFTPSDVHDFDRGPVVQPIETIGIGVTDPSDELLDSPIVESYSDVQEGQVIKQHDVFRAGNLLCFSREEMVLRAIMNRDYSPKPTYGICFCCFDSGPLGDPCQRDYCRQWSGEYVLPYIIDDDGQTESTELKVFIDAEYLQHLLGTEHHPASAGRTIRSLVSCKDMELTFYSLTWLSRFKLGSNNPEILANQLEHWLKGEKSHPNETEEESGLVQAASNRYLESILRRSAAADGREDMDVSNITSYVQSIMRMDDENDDVFDPNSPLMICLRNMMRAEVDDYDAEHEGGH